MKNKTTVFCIAASFVILQTCPCYLDCSKQAVCTLNSQLQHVELLGKVVKNWDAISRTKERLDINPVPQWPLKQGILKQRHHRNAPAVAVRLKHIHFRWFICVLLCRIINLNTVIMQLQAEPLHTINRVWLQCWTYTGLGDKWSI